MLAVDLPKEAQERLEALAAQTGRSASSCATQVILDFLDSGEGCIVALISSREEPTGTPTRRVGAKAWPGECLQALSVRA